MQRFLYSSRPSKYVERSLIVDLCRRLEHIAPVRDYAYVGLGGLEFFDFDLVHRSLGISEMTSIERDTHQAERFNFNRPFRDIRVLFGETRDHLPAHDWAKKLHIVWLDYESQLGSDEIIDAETVVSNCQAGSVLFVTLNAECRPKERFAALAKNLGDKVPADLDEEQLAGEWAFGRVQQDVLTGALEAATTERNPAASLRQFANFNYRDDARMQTIGWVVSSPAVDLAVTNSRIEAQPTSRTKTDDPLVIDLPILTRRELQALNERISAKPGTQPLKAPFIDKDIVLRYAEFYRSYPSLIS